MQAAVLADVSRGLFGLLALAKASCNVRSAETVANEVPRGGQEQESPARLRRMASRAREMARQLLPGDEAADRLNDYAAELEARAQAIDKGRAS